MLVRVELRRRAVIEAAQRDLLSTVTPTAEPEAVMANLQSYAEKLRSGAVDSPRLLIRKRVSKLRSEYTQRTQTVAALERAAHHDIEYSPGEDVRYVVVDDDADTMDRVRLHFEEFDDYDAEFYVTQLVRAAESIISPMGWRRDDIRDCLSDGVDASITDFVT